MVGILSIPDEETFGLDMTRLENLYRINNRDYEIVRPIHVRNRVRGRATASIQYTSMYPRCPRHPPLAYDPGGSRSLMGWPNCPRRWCTSCRTRPRDTLWKAACYLGPSANSGSSTSLGSYNCTPEASEPFGSTAQHVKNCTFWKLSKDDAEKGTQRMRL
ncbi:hypothetical protein EDB83DRAFT_1674838 [Lactarius deliciosus]|nr:hypothetical protein EDB83DRAFT_1674838 [Lactarius deliciosus]